jgi:hypothetical protein
LKQKSRCLGCCELSLAFPSDEEVDRFEWVSKLPLLDCSVPERSMKNELGDLVLVESLGVDGVVLELVLCSNGHLTDRVYERKYGGLAHYYIVGD